METVQNMIKQWDGILESINILKEQVVVLEREKVMLKQKLDEKEEEAKESERKGVNEKEERIQKLEEELRKAKEIWVKFDKGKQQLDEILTQETRMDNKHGLGYSGASSSQQPAHIQPSYKQRVFLKNANTVIETVNVEVADQTEGPQMLGDEEEHVILIQEKGTVSTVPRIYEGALEDIRVYTIEIQESVAVKEKTPSIRIQMNHPADAIIGNVNDGMKTRGKKKNHLVTCLQRVGDAKRFEFLRGAHGVMLYLKRVPGSVLKR
ncbi:hypothetical protein H6P81_012508 [Aristolochia fimbriata]|uniref:Uncharacterized protein n=1 Tax=Aristolochia fimbriata TaxID=158543 RepID=A0AAV7EE49_ARIFI|nr:hypothetical protein H6P81_012508 [Aristolochia fimbriata]